MTETTAIDKDRTYRATGPLMVGRARAANAGDLVHGSTALQHPDWHEQLVLVDEEITDLVPKSTLVKDVLADVGDDKEKAAAALEAEREKGADARSSLVEALEKIIAAA